ncbi:MAG: toxin TcdB middle/N-terminal domain-containing protein, partial [Myxococcota bacterium]
KLDQYDLLTNLYEVTTYRYHEGFYDGQEKQFRGFARVQTVQEGNDTMEGGLTEERFDVGVTDTYRHGLLLSTSSSSAGRDLLESTTTFEDCPVDGRPEGTELAVRFICPTATQTILKEGLTQERWVTTASFMSYDGYGNVTREVDQGVILIGGDGCAPCERDEALYGEPCGPQCIGDEATSLTTYITPGEDTTAGRWLLGLESHNRFMGRDGDDFVAESWTYYDGPDFEGLPLGQATVGDVSRVSVKRDRETDHLFDLVRNAYDEHGNVIATLDPLAEPSGHTHQRQYQYSNDGLRVVQADILLEDPLGRPYRLRRAVRYEPLFDKPAVTTAWTRLVDGQVVSAERSTTFAYDDFGRMLAQFEPGNISNQPDAVMEYDLRSPTSRIITRTRTQ